MNELAAARSITSRALLTAAAGGMALVLASASVGRAELPYMLDQVTTLTDARNRLLQLRDQGLIGQQEMMGLARKMEPRLRGDSLRNLGVMDPGKNPFAITRSGTSPEFGRGIFSDEDLEVKSFEQLRRMKQWAKENNYPITENNRYQIKIEGPDTVVWKPRGRMPADVFEIKPEGRGGLEWKPKGRMPENEPMVMESATAQSLEPEFASGAKPGATPHPLEANLENITKGSKAYFEPLPSGHQAELELVAGAKDVVRSMKAAGMCVGDKARICQNLEDFRSMRKSPRELGFENLDDLQSKLRSLMKESLQESERLFNAEFDELMGRLKNAGSASERRLLMEQVVEMKTRALRMGTRFEVLSNQHPEMMSEMSGGRSVREFWKDKTDKINALSEAGETAAGHVARGRMLNVTLNMALFVKCMQEETSAKQEARLKQAGKCALEAAEGTVVGEIVSQGIGYLAFYSPAGGLVLAGVLTAGSVAFSSYELYEGYLAYNEYAAARDEADAREREMEDGQRRNLATFPGRLAAEEALVRDALREVAAMKKELLSRLAILGEEQDDLTATMDFDARFARLQELLDYLKPAADACFSRKSRPSTGNAGLDEAVQRLTEAVSLAGSCRSKGDLESAERAYALGVERWTSSAAAGASPAVGRVSEEDSRPAEVLTEARSIHQNLVEKGSRAEVVLKETGAVSEDVRQLNGYIASLKNILSVRFEGFKAAFPDDFLEMLNANSPRLAVIESDIQSLKPLVDSDWYGNYKSLKDKDAGLRKLKRYMTDNRLQSRHIIADMSDCLADKGAPGLGTADIQGLMDSYKEKHAACSSAGAGTAAGPQDKPETEEPPPPVKEEEFGPDPVVRMTPEQEAEVKRVAFGLMGQGVEPTGQGNYAKRMDLLHVGFRSLHPVDREAFFGTPSWAKVQKTFAQMQKEEPGSVNVAVDRLFLRLQAVFHGSDPRTDQTSRGAGGKPQGAGGKPEPLARSLLLLALMEGDLSYYFRDPSEAKPLGKGEGLKPGMTLETGKDSKAGITTPNKTTVTMGEKTRVRPSSARDGMQDMQLLVGTVMVERKEGAPGFDDVRVASKHGTIQGAGTRYQVQVSERGTAFQVFEGKARVTGEKLSRAASPADEGAAGPFVQELLLSAGERAFAFPAGASEGQRPPDEQVIRQRPPDERVIRQRPPDERVIRQRPPDEQVIHDGRPPTDDMSGSGRGGRVAGGDKGEGAPLSRPDPWNDPQVQSLIDEWLRTATPVSAATHPGTWRFTEWGQALGPGSQAAGAPSHPAGWSRHQSLWAMRSRFGSLNLCTMGEFVERRLSNKSLEDCAKSSSSGSSAGEKPSTPPIQKLKQWDCLRKGVDALMMELIQVGDQVGLPVRENVQGLVGMTPPDERTGDTFVFIKKFGADSRTTMVRTELKKTGNDSFSVSSLVHSVDREPRLMEGYCISPREYNVPKDFRIGDGYAKPAVPAEEKPSNPPIEKYKHWDCPSNESDSLLLELIQVGEKIGLPARDQENDLVGMSLPDETKGKTLVFIQNWPSETRKVGVTPSGNDEFDVMMVSEHAGGKIYVEMGRCRNPQENRLSKGFKNP